MLLSIDMKATALCCLLSLLFAAAEASDLAREQRIRAHIDNASLTGEPTTLETGRLRFFAIRQAAQTQETLGGVILAHDQAAHPDWSEVIHPLRTQLPEHGWETLSLQMPLAAADAPANIYQSLVAEAAPRFAFAADTLTQRGIEPIVLIGHGLGADMLAQWLAADPPEQVMAFVAIGLAIDPVQPSNATLSALKKIQLPILDIFGSADSRLVTDTAQARKAAARIAKNRWYTQIEIEGATHFFHSLDDVLVARVRAWMRKITLAEKMR